MFLNKNKASLRARLIRLFVGIFGATLILFAFLMYQSFLRIHEQEFDVALFNYAVDISRSVNFDFFGKPTLSHDFLEEGEKIFPFALGESLLQIRAIDGTVIAKSRSLGASSLPLATPELKQILARNTMVRTVPARQLGLALNREYRLLTHLIERPGGGHFLLQVAAPMALLEMEKQGMLTFFLIAIPIVLIIAALGGLYLSRKALAPVTDIISKTREITAHHLSERVPVPKTSDEIQELAQTLNDLFNRLEQTFRAQETFIADASHQLKTPLAILRGEIDVMKSKPRTPQETEEFLNSASQEVGYLSRMVEDLITLARVDAGELSLSLQSYRADETLLEVVARMEHLATKKGVRLSPNLHAEETSVSPFELKGDPDLVRSMLENLVENAIKYSPDQALVRVSLHDRGTSIELMVSDEGRGIDESALPKIFNRFYRSEGTRDKVPGSGLGLAIAKRIAELHHGSISAENLSDGGACFKIALPKDPLA